MLLSGALFALFMTGFWLYCLTDAILTPALECRGLGKRGWVTVIAFTFIGGACAWLVIQRPVRNSARLPMPVTYVSEDGTELVSPVWTDADDAAARHPAELGNASGPRATPKGPDDDPEFLCALGRAIRRNPPVS
jgi:hypothetical protein